MGKKAEGIITDAVIDKGASALEKLMDKFAKLQKEENENREKEKENLYPEEKEEIVKEFNRVLEKLKKTDPATDGYYKIATNADRVLDLLNFWRRY